VSKKKPFWLTSVVVPLAALIGLIYGSKAWFNWHPDFLQPSKEALFRHTGGDWQSVPLLPGRPEAVRVSANGTVWALAFSYDAGEVFARLDGAHWQVYRLNDIGPKGHHSVANDEIVLDGEQLWAAGVGEIIHWNGQGWRIFPNQQAEAIVAGGGEAWALNDTGHLAHFANGQWTAVNAEPPAENWNDDESADYSRLVRTADGGVWLARNRLWRFDGTRWHEISTGFEHVNLLGAVDDGVWTWDGRGLRAIAADGEAQTVFGPQQTGIGQRERVYEVASPHNITYFRTGRSLVAFDGWDWRRVNLPGGGVESLTRIVAGPGGDLWAIGDTPNPLWRYTRFVRPGMSILLMVSLLGIPIWVVRRYKRERLDEAQRVRQAVELATGESPDHMERTERRLTRESSWLGASVSVVLPVAALMAYQTMRMFWRTAPSWSFLLLAVGFHAVHVLWRSVMKKTPKPWDPIEPGGTGYDWSEARKALPGTIGLFLLMNIDTVWRYIGNPVVWILGGFWIWLGYHLLKQRFVNGALKRGEYDEAGKLILRFHLHNPDGPKAQRQHALMLLIAGRYRESEEAARRAIAGTRNGVEQAYALDHLGDALLEQGRYDEAMRAYEAAIKAHDGFRRAYRGMAEVVLRQGANPPRALELVEQIVGPSGPSRNKFGINAEVRDDYWGLKAWALAALGRSAEVAPAIEKAFQFTRKNSKPGMAITFYRAGMAMEAMGQAEQSADYLRRARDSDPEGRAGKLAKAALGERSVFRA
jgi:tetratricopeptide (TPR) repeat protein